MKTIVFTGGGTAGHIIPNLAIIDEINDFKIYYLGSNAMEKNLLTNYPNVEFIEIPAVKLKRSLSFKNLLIPIKLIQSINICKKELKQIKPDIIFSKGGYVSIPVCFAARSLKIPILTHESDFSIGLANKIIAKISQNLCCSFKETAKKYGKNAIFTGSPIRKNILNGDKESTLSRYKITKNKPIILVMGGSLGAKSINNIIWDNIDKLTEKYTIFHIVGKNNINQTISKKDYYQIEFTDKIGDLFAISNLIISRAGSNTIFELLFLQKNMILIPLPKSSGSRGDQEVNAEYFQKKGFAEKIDQKDLTYDNLAIKIEQTLKNRSEYTNNMKNANNIIGTTNIINLINKTINTNPIK